MKHYKMTLSDADDIERFYLETTGMKPEFLQLSRGAGGVDFNIEEYEGITLVWTRVPGRTRWVDLKQGNALQFALAVDSRRPITVRGKTLSPDEAMVWIPGEEMTYTLDNSLNLEICVADWLAEELGWHPEGDPLRRTSRTGLADLLLTCRQASAVVRDSEFSYRQKRIVLGELRDSILEKLQVMLRPWLSASFHSLSSNQTEYRHYRLLRRADEFFECIGDENSFEIDNLAQALGVSRRTVFNIFRSQLGIGPRQYLELRRLHMFRAKLKRANGNETTVTQIAHEFGFGHLGRLAATYRRHFGEYPSCTLKRSTVF